jgi:hypothetical protein
VTAWLKRLPQQAAGRLSRSSFEADKFSEVDISSFGEGDRFLRRRQVFPVSAEIVSASRKAAALPGPAQFAAAGCESGLCVHKQTRFFVAEFDHFANAERKISR